MRPLLLALALLAGSAGPVVSSAQGACTPQQVHSYVSGGTIVLSGLVLGGVSVWDANALDCVPGGAAGEFDGDYESGVGGGFFGWGPWADEATCEYDLNTHGPDVVVFDTAWGSDIQFFMAEDDQAGPAVVGGACVTDGLVSPLTDPDDCISALYVHVGTTCGTGGGDGGYWVFLVSANALVAANPPFTGTITAYGGTVQASLTPHFEKARSAFLVG